MAIGHLPDSPDEGEGAIFADINITPLTDIFLVLLIIFMVTSSVAVDSASRTGVKVNLPKGATKDIDPGAKSIRVLVLASGEVLVDGHSVQPGDLDKLFVSTFGKDPTTQVIIEADEGVRHGQVVGIMNSAKSVGFQRLAIATKGGGG